MKRDPGLRSPLVDGLFYPADKDELEKEVNSLLRGEEGASPALILPHASYSVIGPSYGRAFMRSAARQVSRVLLLAPAHREPEPFAALPPFTRFSTPLGEIETDGEIIESLSEETELFRQDAMPFEEEHSLELPLPFIARLYPGARIIPVLTGSLRSREKKILARALDKALSPFKGELLTVISTNLSRFITPDIAEAEADSFVKYIRNEPVSDKERSEISACGINGLDIFRESVLYGGAFTEISRFSRERKENSKTASVQYGAYFFEEKL